MTKSQIELLMARDVDEVSEVAVHHPKRQLGVTLKNAAALLAREERPKEIEERLFIFKLLRFVQAALAGAGARVPAEVALEVLGSVRLVLKRNIAPDLNRAAGDVLSALTTKNLQMELVRNSLALHGRGALDEPFELKYLRRVLGLKLEHKSSALSAKPDSARTKVSPKPKGLPR